MRDPRAGVHLRNLLCRWTFHLQQYRRAIAEKSPVIVMGGSPGITERAINPLLHHKVKGFRNLFEVFQKITGIRRFWTGRTPHSARLTGYSSRPCVQAASLSRAAARSDCWRGRFAAPRAGGAAAFRPGCAA